MTIPPARICAALLASLFAAPAFSAQVASTQSPGAPARADPPTKVKETEFDFVTNNRAEVVNYNPEPFSAVDFDSAGRVWSINPYADTVVVYSGVTPMPDLTFGTGHNPVSIAVWESGSLPEDRKILVACAGTHGLFRHNAVDGRVERFTLLHAEPADLVLDVDNGWAFVSCQGRNSVQKVDLATFEVLDTYPIDCGQRPGPLYLDRGIEAQPLDNRLYVASTVTGNNSIPLGPGGGVGVVMNVEGFAGGELPDEDIFRIQPFTDQVQAVVRRAGSLIFKLERNPQTQALWILSSDSNNKDPSLQTEPLIKGKLATNQLLTVAGVTSASGLIPAGGGIDLDDFDPNTSGPQYSSLRSLNQARALDFLTAVSGAASGFAFIGGPMSDVIAIVDTLGRRVAEFNLPPKAQCYDIDVYDPSENLVIAHCLGTMTMEVFSWSPFSATPVASLPLGFDPTPDQIRRGRDLFLDGQVSRNGRFTCGTCHPRGRTDQLGWALRGDPCDEKDVMVTQSLLSIADSFPHHWRGERDLFDFKKAFQGLLGAPPGEEPTDEEMGDFIAFMQSLQAPANPIGNPRRVLDDDASPDPAPNGMPGSAVAGQAHFQQIVNFNGQTCAGCHTLGSGSNSNFFEEVGSIAPRAAELEVAHLRQLQHKGLDTVFIDFGGKEPVRFNENGFGAAHNGGLASVFHFIFDIAVFFSLNDQQRVDVFKFVEQFDQGLSPAAHWGTHFHQASPEFTSRHIERVLLEGAHKRWNDAAAFGRFNFGAGFVPVRFWYDPSQRRFVPENPAFPPIGWERVVDETLAGNADLVFVGLAPANGRRFAVDRDNDGLLNGSELALGTDPWNPDSDGDLWPDGQEVQSGDDPLVAQALSADDEPPQLLSSELDFATARLAKYHVAFNEDVTYRIDYSVAGGPSREFIRGYFSRSDTFVLTHSEPSTPTFAPILFDAAITMTDRAGNQIGPVALQRFQPLEAGLMLPPFPLASHIRSVESIQETRNAGSLTATIEIRADLNFGAPNFIAAAGQMIFCSIAVEDVGTGEFAKSTSFTTPQPTGFDLVNVEGEVTTYTTVPGPPWIVSPDTDSGGRTTIQFTQPGLVSGQKVKISVMGIATQTTPPDGHAGTVYAAISLFQMQPLLLEDAAALTIEF